MARTRSLAPFGVRIATVFAAVTAAHPAGAAPFRYFDRHGHAVLVEPEAAAVEAPLDPQVPPDYPFADELRDAAEESALPVALLRAVMSVESNGQPHAISVAGARGLMQLMPTTAAEVGVAAVFDPAENIMGGARYLRKLLDSFDGDLALALASYNAGRGAVQRAGRVAPSRETRRYVMAVLSQYQKFSREEVP